MLTVGSLFAGIGGFDLGLERAGMRSVWQCEIDPYCQRVLARHWPDVLRVPDIRDLGVGTAAPVDVICGGFPCQDISLAGRGAGIGGERSGLWSEYARVVDELRPRYVVVENVAALLARGLDRVLADLAALGYDAEWDCIPASAVGAPHRRDRLWLVAYPGGDDGRARRQGRPTTGGQGQSEPVRALQVADAARDVRAGSAPAGSERERVGASGERFADEGRTLDDASGGRHGAPEGEVRAGWDGSVDAGWWLAEPDVGRVAHGVPSRVDRLRALGNALVPQIAEWLGRRIIEWEEGVDRVAA